PRRPSGAEAFPGGLRSLDQILGDDRAARGGRATATRGGRRIGGGGVVGVFGLLDLIAPDVFTGEMAFPFVSGGQVVTVDAAEVDAVFEPHPVPDPRHTVDQDDPAGRSLGYVAKIVASDDLRPLLESGQVSPDDRHGLDGG